MAPHKIAKKSTGGKRDARSLWNNPATQWKLPFGKTKSLLDASVTPSAIEKVMRKSDKQNEPFATPVTAEALDQRIP